MSNAQKTSAPRLVFYGTGQYGLEVVRIAAEKNWPIVAAYNRAGEKVGQDLGRLAGLDRDLGVIVEDCDTASYDNLEADIAIVVMQDRISYNFQGYERMLSAGLNVISHGTEGYFPYYHDSGIDEQVAKLDAIAKEHGVTYTGSGIWDMSRIWAGILVTGACTRIDSMCHRSLTDVARGGPDLMLFAGTSLTVDEYKKKVGSPEGTSLLSLFSIIPEQVLVSIGYHTKNVSFSLEPIVLEKPTYCSANGETLQAGIVSGTRVVCEVESEEGLNITFHHEVRLLEEGETEHMYWQVDGKPSVSMTIEREDSLHFSASSLFNRIRDVIAAPPGIQLFTEMGPMKHSALE